MVRFSLDVDLVEEKNTAFVHIKKKSSIKVTEKDVRLELRKMGITFEKLKSSTDKMFIFQINEIDKSIRDAKIEELQSQEVSMTDLTLSYGASELPPAPKEMTDPEPELEEEPKPTRRRRTRRKTTKTVESSE